MHVLVLICSNPDHPSIREMLKDLSPDAQAIAILILRSLRKDKRWGSLPSGIESNHAKFAEIKAAAKEFKSLTAVRRGVLVPA